MQAGTVARPLGLPIGIVIVRAVSLSSIVIVPVAVTAAASGASISAAAAITSAVRHVCDVACCSDCEVNGSLEASAVVEPLKYECECTSVGLRK